MNSHPDRRLATLADAAAVAAAEREPRQPPPPGAGDCRIDLKLLQWRALRAAGRSAAARARLEPFDPMLRPDLWAGTVQDGTARGFAVALEEAIALAPPEPAPPARPNDPTRVQVFTGTALRKKKDLLVESAGPRIRFSRKEGVLFVDRTTDVHSANCLRFEARSDRGTLDGFAGDEGERPRLFSAQFLKPERYVAGAGHTELVLAGRLGRGPRGFDCRVVLAGGQDSADLSLRILIDNRQRDHRLRVRFLGIPMALLHHHCTDVHEVVQDGPGFVAFTLVRACGRLCVDDREVAVPAAQCQGPIEHEFVLGMPGARPKTRP